MSTTTFQGYNLVTATQTCFKKYADFSGRATRSEYWFFQLTYIIIAVICECLFGQGSTVDYIVRLAFLLPTLSVFVRRMHDTGRSAWNILWSFLPIIGWIIMIVYCCLDSQPGTNKYGSSEKYPEGDAPQA